MIIFHENRTSQTFEPYVSLQTHPSIVGSRFAVDFTFTIPRLCQ